MLWNPLNDAAEYRQAAKDRRERGGGSAVQMRTRTQAQQFWDWQRQAMTTWDQAVADARNGFKCDRTIEHEHLLWRLSDECWTGDVPF